MEKLIIKLFFISTLIFSFFVSCKKNKELTSTELAAYKFCNEMLHKKCIKNSILCHPLDTNHDVDVCNISYIIKENSKYKYEKFSCQCKNLVCEYWEGL